VKAAWLGAFIVGVCASASPVDTLPTAPHARLQILSAPREPGSPQVPVSPPMEHAPARPPGCVVAAQVPCGENGEPRPFFECGEQTRYEGETFVFVAGPDGYGRFYPQPGESLRTTAHLRERDCFILELREIRRRRGAG